MDYPISIPENIKNILKDWNIIYVQHSDLTENRQFGTAYLVLTSENLLVVGNSKVICRFNLDDLREVFTEELIGGGRVSARTRTGIFHLLYYSNHLVEEFTKTTRLINDYLKGDRLVLPESSGESFCKRCGSPLPERACNCPRCVPRIKILKRIVTLAFPYKKEALFLLFITAAGVLLQVLPPYLTRGIIDDCIGRGNRETSFMWAP